MTTIFFETKLNISSKSWPNKQKITTFGIGINFFHWEGDGSAQFLRLYFSQNQCASWLRSISPWFSKSGKSSSTPCLFPLVATFFSRAECRRRFTGWDWHDIIDSDSVLVDTNYENQKMMIFQSFVLEFLSSYSTSFQTKWSPFRTRIKILYTDSK